MLSHYLKKLPAFPPLEHVVIATLSFLWAAQVTAGANGGDAQDRNPASGPPEVRTHDADRGVSMIDRLVMLQHQWTSEKAELKKIASANEEADISPEDFQAWLIAARHGEDAELRSRVLAHDQLIHNMEQAIQSLSRSASASPAHPVASPKEAVAEDMEIRQELFQGVQSLTVLQAERTALEANEETVPEELQQRIATVEQEIFTTFSRLNSSRVLIEAEDGDSQ